MCSTHNTGRARGRRRERGCTSDDDTQRGIPQWGGSFLLRGYSLLREFFKVLSGSARILSWWCQVLLLMFWAIFRFREFSSHRGVQIHYSWLYISMVQDRLQGRGKLVNKLWYDHFNLWMMPKKCWGANLYWDCQLGAFFLLGLWNWIQFCPEHLWCKRWRY